MGQRVIGLMTDFGTKDHYVASMKATIFQINPNVKVIDITHEITPHDIFEAAFVLRTVYKDFPFLSMFVTVVDPGVGTSRKPILVCTDNYYFFTPDNGIVSFVLLKEPLSKVIHLTADHYFSSDMSTTFHGRDIFATTAAWMSKGIDSDQLGDPIDSFVRLKVPGCAFANKTLKGLIIHVDRFGNLITSIHKEDIDRIKGHLGEKPFTIQIKDKTVTEFRADYAGQKGALFYLFGGAGYLEIASSKMKASDVLKAGRGEAVTITFG